MGRPEGTCGLSWHRMIGTTHPPVRSRPSCLDPAVVRSPRCSSPSCSWRVPSRRPSAGPTVATWATPTGPTTGSSARRSRSSETTRRHGSTSTPRCSRRDDPDKLFWATNEHVFNEKGHGRGAVDRISRVLSPGAGRAPGRRRSDGLDHLRLDGPLLRGHPPALSHQLRGHRSRRLAPALRDARPGGDPEPGRVAGVEHRQPHPRGRRRRADDRHRGRCLFAQVLPRAVSAVQGR